MFTKSALSLLGERQQSLLTALLRHRKGLTAGELSSLLSISRNAINQHLTSLRSNGFIQSALQESTGGRPGRVYKLTSSGSELFQRQYSFLAKLLLSWIDKNTGESEWNTCLSGLGKQIADGFEGRIAQRTSRIDRLQEAATIMCELGYDARVSQTSERQAEIIVNNCIFHKLAQQNQEFCKLDISFMEHLLKADIEHTECIVKNGDHCRFKITNSAENLS